MLKLNKIMDMPPFSLNRQKKKQVFGDLLFELTKHHYNNCQEYHNILDVLECNPLSKINVKSLPPLPVRLFKDNELCSVERSEIIKTMTSSGTSGQRVSKIFLDKMTARNQTQVLTKIVSSFIGTKRLPMLIIDSKSVLKDRNLFSARGAGIVGFSMLGYDVTYALDESMQLDVDAIEVFIQKHGGKNILIFGFTFMIWQYFYKPLLKLGKKLELENGIMIHGGGWKKLIEQAVDNDTFKSALEKICMIERVHNYYGMVEQTGSIFMECEAGYLHASNFSDISVLGADFGECKMQERGLVKLSSLLPLSYPGHILLSEDIGEIIGEDDCQCGRFGKYFKIHGRIMNAEGRGCSDTYDSV